MKKQRPIIFSTDMVKAIMEGRKIETRRVVKPQPGNDPRDEGYISDVLQRCPYGKPGDILYVRESFTIGHNVYIFKTGDESDDFFKWKPSIHMPKKAARIWLEIQDRWVERLQDVSEESAKNEGLKYNRYVEPPAAWYYYYDYLNNDYYHRDPVKSFRTLWKSIHGPGSWEQNPFVWVVKFKVLSTNGKPYQL